MKRNAKLYKDPYLIKREYMKYVFEIFNPDEYNILIANRFDIDNAIGMLFSIIQDTGEKKRSNVLTRNKILIYSETFDASKLLNLFYGETSVDKRLLEIYEKSFNTNSYIEVPTYDNHRLYYVLYHVLNKKSLEYVDPSILGGPTFKNKKKVHLTEYVSKEYNILMLPKTDEIFTLVEKLRTYIDTIPFGLEEKILSLGLMREKYEDEIKYGNIDKEGHLNEYLSMQKYILDVILREWNFSHRNLQNKDSLMDTLSKYITNRKTAREVFDFLDKQIKYYSNYDISKSSVEKEKIELQELRDMRMNVFYNLTPNEKMELNKYEFGTDDWNRKLDSMMDQDTGIRINIKTENVDPTNADINEEDYY